MSSVCVCVCVQTREREFSDNLQLRRKQEEVEEIEAKLLDLRDRLGGLNVANLRTETTNLEATNDRLKGEVTLAGHRLGLRAEASQGLNFPK